MKNESEQAQLAQQVKQMRDNMPALTEYTALQAKIIRAKFEALIELGFTSEQAVDLCKG